MEIHTANQFVLRFTVATDLRLSTRHCRYVEQPPITLPGDYRMIGGFFSCVSSPFLDLKRARWRADHANAGIQATATYEPTEATATNTRPDTTTAGRRVRPMMNTSSSASVSTPSTVVQTIAAEIRSTVEQFRGPG